MIYKIIIKWPENVCLYHIQVYRAKSPYMTELVSVAILSKDVW